MKKAIRILAGLGAVVLIIFLLILTMGFTGNPISKVLATRSADKYIEENYSDLDLIREETVFEFKQGYYIVKYYKPNSKDIHFGIETDYLGRITIDGYESVVLSKVNTRFRLNDEFGEYIDKIVRENLNYDFDFDMNNYIALGDEESQEERDALDIDMVFNMENLPVDQYINIYIFEENRTWDRLAEVMLELDQLMEKHNLDISAYSVILQEPRAAEGPIEEALGVYDFPKDNINSEDLPRDLKNFYNGWKE